MILLEVVCCRLLSVLRRASPTCCVIISSVLISIYTGQSSGYTLMKGSTPWDLSQPVKLSVFNFLDPNVVSIKDQEDIILSCAKKWAQVSGLRFKYLGNSWDKDSADIMIRFMKIDGPMDPLTGEGYDVGSSQGPYKGHKTSLLDIDSEEKWKAYGNSTKDGSSLEELICHEMGHTLGLDHSPWEGAIMHKTLPYSSHRVKLGRDDIAGIQRLYKGPVKGQISLTGQWRRQFTPSYSKWG